MGQQNTANTARSGVECSTITISIDGKYDDSKSSKLMMICSRGSSVLMNFSNYGNTTLRTVLFFAFKTDLFIYYIAYFIIENGNNLVTHCFY